MLSLSIVGIQKITVNDSVFPAKTCEIGISLTPKKLSIPKKPLSNISCCSSTQIGNEKKKVVVKAMERPRLVLKFIWMEKNIGIAIDQLIPGGHGSIPVSPYYFWPRKDAWEELKLLIETKPWISNKQKVILLNHATDIINLWQQTAS